MHGVLRSKVTLRSHWIRAGDIKTFLQKLQTSGVADNNGIYRTWSSRHVLIEIKAWPKRIMSVLDLCGDETNLTDTGGWRKRVGRLLRIWVPWGYWSPTMFVRQLPHFPKVTVVFFSVMAVGVSRVSASCAGSGGQSAAWGLEGKG